MIPKKAATLILEKFCNSSQITLASDQQLITGLTKKDMHTFTQRNSPPVNPASFQHEEGDLCVLAGINPQSFYSEILISMLPPTPQ